MCQSVKKESQKIDSKVGEMLGLHFMCVSVLWERKSHLKCFKWHSENCLVPVELAASPDHHTLVWRKRMHVSYDSQHIQLR